MCSTPSRSYCHPVPPATAPCQPHLPPADILQRTSSPTLPAAAATRLALVTAAKAVALALCPGIEVIKFATLWSKKRGLGPYVEFIDSTENLEPDWHPEQIEVFDYATNIKVGGRGMQGRVQQGVTCRAPARLLQACEAAVCHMPCAATTLAACTHILHPPAPPHPATYPLIPNPAPTPQVNAAEIGEERLGEFLHVASMLQPLYAGRALELELLGADQASLATAAPIADCFEIAYYCVRNSMLHPKFRTMPPLHTYIWLGTCVGLPWARCCCCLLLCGTVCTPHSRALLGLSCCDLCGALQTYVICVTPASWWDAGKPLSLPASQPAAVRD
jgi:hypothetical protein